MPIKSKEKFDLWMNRLIIGMVVLIIILLLTAKCEAQHRRESDHDRIIRLEEKIDGFEKRLDKQDEKIEDEKNEFESYYNYDYGLGQIHKQKLENQGNKDIVQYIILGFLGVINAIFGGKFVVDIKRKKNGNTP